MTLTPKNSGWIEVICGPMFSGKTEELIRRLVRAQIAKQKVQFSNPVQIIDLKKNILYLIINEK